MTNILNIYDEFGWEKAEGYPVGTRIKTLRYEIDSKTLLLKPPQGFHLEAHTHVYNEQHLVLEGDHLLLNQELLFLLSGIILNNYSE